MENHITTLQDSEESFDTKHKPNKLYTPGSILSLPGIIKKKEVAQDKIFNKLSIENTPQSMVSNKMSILENEESDNNFEKHA